MAPPPPRMAPVAGSCCMPKRRGLAPMCVISPLLCGPHFLLRWGSRTQGPTPRPAPPTKHACCAPPKWSRGGAPRKLFIPTPPAPRLVPPDDGACVRGARGRAHAAPHCSTALAPTLAVVHSCRSKKTGTTLPVCFSAIWIRRTRTARKSLSATCKVGLKEKLQGHPRTGREPHACPSPPPLRSITVAVAHAASPTLH